MGTTTPQTSGNYAEKRYIFFGKITFKPPKLPAVLEVAPQTTKKCQKDHICQNIPIIPLPSVIFSIKK